MNAASGYQEKQIETHLKQKENKKQRFIEHLWKKEKYNKSTRYRYPLLKATAERIAKQRIFLIQTRIKSTKIYVLYGITLKLFKLQQGLLYYTM